MRDPSKRDSSASAPRRSSASGPSADPKGVPVARYAVYWTQPAAKKLLLLHFPNRARTQPYNARADQQPRALRLKPGCGLVELDVSLRGPPNETFDPGRGLEYGTALRRNRMLAQGGAFGMAGGFGMGHGPIPVGAGAVPKGLKRSADEGLGGENEWQEDAEDPDRPPRDYDDAVRRGMMLDKVTLSGRVRKSGDGDPIYAIGVFRGSELHLTRVDAFCALQPQLTYLDAMADNERVSRRAAAREAEDAPAESEARAVTMAVKSVDDEEMDMGEIAKKLKEMQDERWVELEWVDEEDPRAYALYRNDLVLADEGKGRTLVASLTSAQYLDAISAPRVDPAAQGEKVMVGKAGDSGDESSDADVKVKIEGPDPDQSAAGTSKGKSEK